MNSPRSKTAAFGGRLAAARSFVVQLHEDPPKQASKPVSGRVENVATGEQAQFGSLQELDEFMRRSAAREI
ncbi:hypothetical protein [Solimonas sp. SE-A11]|uniref:hypothetical protein n=1 Tax=Solimonas sp. SE-A11 TaxID=3054954 RepID=UPI00259CE3F2|nr:hypothetical protein [Solimonas sp. SE-A11]MDM4772616.1 hypothetical protein [Solimonas sp. SE-A11]